MSNRQFNVKVNYTMQRTIKVWAEDEYEASENACDITNKWKDVIDSESVGVEEAE